MNILHKLKLFIITILIFCNVNLVFGDNSKVSILTYEPGDELYTIFGHTALRIQDSALNIDNIYNFGTFDFSSPFFYIKFFGGRLDYFLTILDYRTFIYYASIEQRTIYEQTLNVTKAERDHLYNKLEQIYHSNERFYRYDFFYDNCATRVRDLVKNVNTKFIHYDTTKFCCKTFRELLKPYISKNYWIDLGINLALGKEADRIAKSSDFMFLPYYIYMISEYSNKVIKTDTIIDLSEETHHNNIFSLTLLFFIIILTLILLFLPRTRLFTFYAINSLIALIGLFLLILSLFSKNSAFRDNFNIFWTLPTIIVLVSKGNARRLVEAIYLIGLVIVLIFRDNLYSGFSTTFIPWMSIIIVMYILDILKIERNKTFANSR